MRILVISNRFCIDATHYLHQIGKAAGRLVDVITISNGNSSLECHYRSMLNGKENYDLICNGTRTGFCVSLEQALLSNQFDVVTLQQTNANSPDADSYQPYAQELYDFIKQCQPTAKVLMHQNWAYADGSDKLTAVGYDSAKAMLADIQNAYAQCSEDLGADGIIPCGEMMMQLLDRGVESVHKDGQYASPALGRYALGLLWFRMLTGESVAENTFNNLDKPFASEEEIQLAKEVVDSFEPLSL